MMRIVAGSVLLLFVIGGLFVAALPWLQQYAEQPAVSPAAGGTQEGLPYVDPDALPELYPVQDFAFFDQTGEVFTSDVLEGKIWVGYLFFTACPGICPIMMENLKKVHAAVGESDRVHYAGFTVDPANDTPERLTRYREGYGVTTPRWHLLTGPMEHINRVAMDSFKLGAVDDPVFHSDKFVLVDGGGNVRGYFTSTDDAETRKLTEAIATLLEEPAV
jgi:protein SCO1/2